MWNDVTIDICYYFIIDSRIFFWCTKQGDQKISNQLNFNDLTTRYSVAKICVDGRCKIPQRIFDRA